MMRAYAMLLVLLVAESAAIPDATGQVRIDHTSTELGVVPDGWVAHATQTLHIAYSHTSHGSQIISGMDALEGFPPYEGRFEWSDDGSIGLDFDDQGIPCQVADLSRGDFLDENGVTPWVTCTRQYLRNTANSHVNVVMWSWCSINGHDVERYIVNMETLISEFPEVSFVFMTGHAQGQGADVTPGGVHFNNERIRQHCSDYGRILFDFADIEAYDPDGTYYWDFEMMDNLDYSGGNWAVDWLSAHPGSELDQLTTGNGISGFTGCASCAHSDTPPEAKLNCVLKGRAAWWMFATLAGWQPRAPDMVHRTSGRRLVP